MKKLFTFLLVIFCINGTLFAQKDRNQFDAEGHRNGVWEKKYSNGNVRYIGQFEHGKEIGVFKFYAISGEEHPMVIKEFSKNTNTVTIRYYSKKGKLESKGIMEGKLRIGEWTYFFPNGKSILSTENYKNGLLDGEVRIYYKTGKLTEVSHYKAGKLHGTRVRYGDQGNTTEELTFQNGIMHGPATIYDEKGEVYAKGNYEKGQKTGFWEFMMDGAMVRKQPEKLKKE